MFKMWVTAELDFLCICLTWCFICAGSSDSQELSWLGIIHVHDVARAHILVYETADAKGRHLCTNGITHFSDLAEEVAQMYPQYNVYRCMHAVVFSIVSF